MVVPCFNKGVASPAFIIVHELAHLIEPSHNSRFTAVLDRFLPHWQQQRDELNRLPVRHEEWGY